MDTTIDNTMPFRTIRSLALLVAFSMAAVACGGSSADTSYDDSSGGGLIDSETGRSGDNYSINTETTEAMEESEAMDDASDSSDAEEALAPATTTVVRESSEDESVDGGFFAEPEEDIEVVTQNYGIRQFVETRVDPLSTFALDVDTGSHSVARQYLNDGHLPPQDSVRVEEFVNSVSYDYPAPRSGLRMNAEGGPSPFDVNNVVVRIGVQAEQVSEADRPAASLTFVIDTSGSMDRDNRIGLVRRSLVQLVRELDEDDTVAIVTYSSGSTVLLEPTSVRDRDYIIDVIEDLKTTGSTNLEAGLERGYDLARQSFVSGGINRVILTSDGIANVGLTDPDGLASQLRDDADSGIHLLTVGVGMDGYNDVLMEQLADNGDGFYAYIDSDAEASELFSDQLVSTLLTVAIDAKIQVDFNRDTVLAYRLLGFENRAVLDSDFTNDRVDAGELGAGHQVTAVYELTLVGGGNDRDNLGTVALRWQDPGSGSVIENRLEISRSMVANKWDNTSTDFRMAVTMASFAEVLRGSPFADSVELSQVQVEAERLIGENPDARELAEMAETAQWAN